jgi:hypothetical protein
MRILNVASGSRVRNSHIVVRKSNKCHIPKIEEEILGGKVRESSRFKYQVISGSTVEYIAIGMYEGGPHHFHHPFGRTKLACWFREAQVEKYQDEENRWSSTPPTVRWKLPPRLRVGRYAQGLPAKKDHPVNEHKL